MMKRKAQSVVDENFITSLVIQNVKGSLYMKIGNLGKLNNESPVV